MHSKLHKSLLLATALAGIGLASAARADTTINALFMAQAAYSEADVRAIVAQRAKDAGTDSAEIDVATEFRVSTVEAQRMFIEAHVVAVASGRPRIAV